MYLPLTMQTIHCAFHSVCLCNHGNLYMRFIIQFPLVLLHWSLRNAMNRMVVRCQWNYCQACNIRRTNAQNSNVSRLVLQLSLCNVLYPGVENEDVVGAAPTGSAPSKSEWLKILLSTKVWFISELWGYIKMYRCNWHVPKHTEFNVSRA